MFDKLPIIGLVMLISAASTAPMPAVAAPEQRYIVYVDAGLAQALADAGRAEAVLARWSEALGAECRLVRRFRDNAWIISVAPPQPDPDVFASRLATQPGVEDVEPDSLLGKSMHQAR